MSNLFVTPKLRPKYRFVGEVLPVNFGKQKMMQKASCDEAGGGRFSGQYLVVRNLRFRKQGLQVMNFPEILTTDH